jgi:hypothetical protein
MTAAELFPEELEEYLEDSKRLARAEAAERERYEREMATLRKEAGRRYAAMLGLDPDRWWEPCSVLILSSKLEWRLRACETVLAEIRRQAARQTPKRKAS